MTKPFRPTSDKRLPHREHTGASARSKIAVNSNRKMVALSET
jgi:hypothetical protein